MCYIHWNPSIEVVNLVFYSIRWYGICWMFGLIGAYFIVKKIYKLNNIGEEKFLPLFFYTLMGVLIGARLGHCLFYEPEYFLGNMSNFVEMFLPIKILPNGEWKYIGYAGLASHGGVIGLFFAIFLYCKHVGIKYLFVLDCIGFAAPFTAMCIRLGNLMNSEIIGKPTNVPWAFVFDSIDQIPRHPTQLYEALFYGLVFCMGVILFQKYRKNIAFGTGFYFGFCLVTIFIFRFFIEFLKEVQVDFESYMLLDMGQILSIPLIAIGFVVLIYVWGRKIKA